MLTLDVICMTAFQIALSLLLFLYDGKDHHRFENEMHLFCKQEHIYYTDISYYLAPLFDRNHILLNHGYQLQCTQKYSLRYYLILLYTYFEKEEYRN